MNDQIRQLSTLSQLREKERDEKRIEFAKVAEEIRALKSFLQSLEDAISNANIEILNARKTTSTIIADRQIFNAFRSAKEGEISELDDQISEVKLAIQNANMVLEEKRKQLVKAEAALKAVDKTVENERLKIKKIQMKKIEDEADEIAQTRWGKQ